MYLFGCAEVLIQVEAGNSARFFLLFCLLYVIQLGTYVAVIHCGPNLIFLPTHVPWSIYS